LRRIWSVLANTDVKKASQETIRQTLIKNELKPWRSAEWYIPPGGNGEFVAAKEDVVDVYTREEEEKRPLGCMDECPKQLIGEVRTPLPAGAGTMVK
jgi:hypothetical protein